jgi:nicotinamidase-related amidase
MDALVVIDVQQGLFSMPQYPPHDGEAVVERIARLVGAARASGMPVLYVQHAGGEGDPLNITQPGFAFRPELAPLASDNVTVKRQPSAFEGTAFDETLKSAGVDHLVICGMETDCCVNATVRAAAERGYRVSLVSDAHTTAGNGKDPPAEIIAQHNADLGEIATLVTSKDLSF